MSKPPSTDDARMPCDRYDANAVLILAFRDGKYAGASYGAGGSDEASGRRRCQAMAAILDWIVGEIKAGRADVPSCLRWPMEKQAERIPERQPEGKPAKRPAAAKEEA